ncbi:septal ring lytic transglycosylase RlpA family protein [Thiosocius teredinicola]|uniref:septal ring lytic transglycosylase RlpA family protein n=1 Tax=Thiosocius teredinicola TaxID=1973002 RepID=UPI002FE44D30
MNKAKRITSLRWLLIGAITAGLLAGCGSRGPTYDDDQDGPGEHRDVSSVPDAVPKEEPYSRYGNPVSYVVLGKRYHTMRDHKNFKQRGIASWYGKKFHGRRTSSGETYDMYRMTAAHKELPIPTYAEVVNLENGRRVVVKINDRGPFHENRIIDLSYAAASRIGMLGKGTALVEVRTIDPSGPQGATKVAATTAPAAPPSVEPTAPPLPPEQVAKAPRIYLQAGAFSSSHNAEQLRQRLQNGLARTVRVSPTVTADGQMHRVQVGPLASVETADQVSAQMHQFGVAEPIVIIE